MTTGDNMKKGPSEAGRYLILGALFGLAFPGISLFLVLVLEVRIEVLLAIIGTAPVFLGIFARFAGVRQDRINEVNRGLEETVEARTRSIRRLLDVSGEGYLSFDAEFVVDSEYSKACEAIFGGAIDGKSIDILLFEDDGKRAEFRQGMELFFTGRSRGDVIFDLLDSETTVGGKILELEFKVIDEGHILCAVKDVSDQRALQETRNRDAREQQVVVHVITHRKYFAAFTREAAELFDFFDSLGSDPGDDAWAVLQRKLHTFKGNASFFHFESTKDRAHEIEFAISDGLLLGDTPDASDLALILKKAYYDEIAIVENRLGTSWLDETETVTVPAIKYRKIESYVKKRYPADSRLNAALKSFRMVRMDSLFVRFPDMAERLAEQLGKKIRPMEIHGGTFPVLPERYEALIGSFVHIVRNILDHGIESPSERELKNKDPEGTVSVTLESTDGNVSIAFSDDGKGLSAAEITRKARDRGLIPEGRELSRAAVYSLIFHHDFSTSDDVNDISGRGHGLAAVKEEVDHVGGRITLSTTPDKGTTFRITIPERRKRARNP